MKCENCIHSVEIHDNKLIWMLFCNKVNFNVHQDYSCQLFKSCISDDFFSDLDKDVDFPFYKSPR